MSTGVFVQDAPQAIEQLEQQVIVERESVEPELNEDTALLGYSKRPFPKRVVLLLIILTIYALSVVSTMPAGIDITYRFICYFLDIEQGKCLTSDMAGEKVASFASAGSVVRGAFALFVSSYLSALSDRLGRKPIFVVAMLLTAASHLSSWYIVFHLDSPSTYWWLLVPTVIDGVGGGLSLVITLSVAYVSDMVPDATSRTRLLAILDGCFFGSIALGPTLGSWVIKLVGIEMLFIMTTVCALLAAVLTQLFLQESLSKFHRRRNSTTKRSLGGTLSILSFSHVESVKSRRNARILLACALLGTEFATSFLAVLMLYPKRKFGWTAVESGYLVSAMSSTRTVWFVAGFPYAYLVLAKYLKIYKDRVDKVDVLLLRVGLLFSIVGYLLMAKAGNQDQFFVAGIVDACSSIGMPIYKSALIKHVPQGQFGSFLAAFNFICSAASVFAPTLFIKLYSWSYVWKPNLSFEIMGVLFVTILTLTFLLKPFK